ncbi:unnamed protein product [Pedinophyceae sp. YPF-701]|nr:unnamed protein product [Pedinophyceae sp. YPF-701]
MSDAGEPVGDPPAAEEPQEVPAAEEAPPAADSPGAEQEDDVAAEDEGPATPPPEPVSVADAYREDLPLPQKIASIKKVLESGGAISSRSLNPHLDEEDEHGNPSPMKIASIKEVLAGGGVVSNRQLDPHVAPEGEALGTVAEEVRAASDAASPASPDAPPAPAPEASAGAPGADRESDDDVDEGALDGFAVDQPPIGANGPQRGRYDPDDFLVPPEEGISLPASTCEVHSVLGLNAHRRNNLAYVSDDVVVSAAGAELVFLNVSDTTLEQRFMPSLDGAGVGAFAVHPSKKWLAVAEMSLTRSPNIYVYAFPSLELQRVLRGGTERAYNALAFNPKGDMLASVGSSPDYMLTLWNWDAEATVLRSKAFSQEVFNVTFSRYFDGLLYTSGIGHVRFWKMANTFTGLKLQGQIGKFGAVEISDIAGYVEMPDGKVLSGSEYGELLLWDGGLIKAVIRAEGDKPCHAGAVECIYHDKGSNAILTAGADGYIRTWPFKELYEADPEDGIVVSVPMLTETLVRQGVRIKSLLVEADHMLIQDEAGGLLRVVMQPPAAPRVLDLMRFHSGSVVGMAAGPASHFVATAGVDGTVRVYDYRDKTMSHSMKLEAPVTCLEQCARAVDPDGRLLFAGGADGVLRALWRVSGGFKLVGCEKPHAKPITQVKCSPDGLRLVTAAADGGVFFFKLVDSLLVPQAMVQVESKVTTVAWSADSSKLLVGCENGDVFRYTPPALHETPGKSFLTSLLPRDDFVFVKPYEPVAAEAAEQPDADAEAASQPENSADSPPEDGAQLERTATSAPPKDEDTGPWPVERLVFRGDDNDAFFIQLGAKMTGATFACSFLEKGIPAERYDEAPSKPNCPARRTALTFSQDGMFCVQGFSNGLVRLQRLLDSPRELPRTPPKGPSMWQASVQSFVEGGITALTLSFDNSYLLVAGADGTLVAYLVSGIEGAVQREGTDLALPTYGEDPMPVKDPIKDPDAYTIEEAQQKAEQDAIRAEADRKKMTVKQRIEDLRRKLKALKEADARLPAPERLPEEAWAIDRRLRDMMRERIEGDIGDARKALAWESERCRLSMEKLRERFFGSLEVERIVVRAIDEVAAVATLRATRLPARLADELNASAADDEGLLERRRVALNKNQSFGIGSAKRSKSFKDFDALSQGAQSQGSGDDGARQEQASKQEQRRQARMKRQQEWAAFLARKPDDKTDNPVDVAAIQEAERTLGDWKLKSDVGYLAPEHLRVDARKKRRMVLDLEVALFNLRMTFNKDVLSLRDRKLKLLGELSRKYEELAEVAHVLGEEEAVPTLRMAADEQPERRFVVTEEDILAHKKALADEEKAAAKSKAGGFGGFAGGGGGGGGGAAGQNTPGKMTPQSSTGRAKDAGFGPVAYGGGKGRSPPAKSRAGAEAAHAVKPTALQEARAEVDRARLGIRRELLREEIARMVRSFDEEVQRLRERRFVVEADLKYQQGRQLVMLEEMAILRDLGRSEDQLRAKLEAKLAEQEEGLRKIEECESRLEKKAEEVAAVNERKAAVAEEFSELVNEKHPFREQLHKVFTKRVKRSKGGADEEAEGSEASDSDAGSDYGSDADDEDEDGCPSGCEQLLYEKVCELRERRLDEEDVLMELAKGVEAVNKEREMQSKRLRMIESSLQALEEDMMDLERQKQREMNEVSTNVILRMHQVEYLDDGHLPRDLSDALVFSQTARERLKARIGELMREKQELRAQQRQLRRDHVQLQRELGGREKEIGDLRARADEIQVLKFGSLVDLDLLDRAMRQRANPDLQEELKRQERRFARELAEVDRSVAEQQQVVARLTLANTNLLQDMAGLLEERRSIDRTLKVVQTQLFADHVQQRRAELAERRQMIEVVQTQAEEIDAIKAEIQRLRSKTASIYS